MAKHAYSFLALGDSYTIGESVALYESFPYQVVQLLRKKGIHIHAPEIIAKTGWTTFDLAGHILHTTLNTPYDFVSLAIGVNNQYQNLPLKDYETDFEFLLKKAIYFSGEHAHRVIVLSLPDWSATPFAHGKNTKKIAGEIDLFNNANKKIAGDYKVKYVNITTGSKEVAHNSHLVAGDKLHPSGPEYARWASLIAEIMLKAINMPAK